MKKNLKDNKEYQELLEYRDYFQSQVDKTNKRLKEIEEETK